MKHLTRLFTQTHAHQENEKKLFKNLPRKLGKYHFWKLRKSLILKFQRMTTD